MFSLLTNVSHLGDIVPEVPLPMIHNILRPTQLSTNTAKEILDNGAPDSLISRVTHMIQDSSIEYVKLKSSSAQLNPSPSPLLHGLINKGFSSFNNILAQPLTTVSGLPTTRVESIKLPSKPKLKGKEKYIDITIPQKSGKLRAKATKIETNDTIDLEKCFGCPELNNFVDLIDDLFGATDVEYVGKENVSFAPQYNGIMNEQGVVSSEFLSKIRAEIALVSNSSTSSLTKVPLDVLSRLMSILEQQVQLGTSLILTNATKSDNYGKILASLEAALVVLSLMLVDNMPKSVFVEEFIENMLATIKFQLFSNILAYHDSSFKVNKHEEEEDTKGDQEEPVQKKTKKESRQNKNAIDSCVKHITGYISEILDKFHALASTFVFTDSVVLQLSNITLPIFFVEGVNSLQLGGLNVVRAIFSKYPSHRALILEEVFGNLAKLPKTKRNLRTYKLPMENKCIQMVSALVMQLIQSCTALPMTPTEGHSSEDDSENSFRAALICAKTFLSSFMKRCSNKTQEDDYRPILENFTDDILTTLNMPEWPAAEILLQILNQNIVANIAKKTDPANVLRMLSIELLGSIGAKLRTEINSCDEPATIPATLVSASGDEDARCICNKGDFGSFMLDCDDCHKWFHGACVGIDSANPPKYKIEICDCVNIWYCDACQLKRQVGSHKKKAGKQSNDANEASSATSADVMKQVYLNYLTARARNDPSCVFSRQFCLAQWCHYDQGKGEGVTEYYRSQWDLPAKTPNNSEVTITREGIMKIGRSLASQRGQHKAFDATLSNLLAVLVEPQRSCRAKAMRALTIIVEADSNILIHERVQNSVKNSFLDESPSVRESTIDLVGRFVLSKPDLVSTYYEKIVDRASDTAVSVRKRVVKLLRDICFQQPNNPFMSKISRALVGRINDEDSIKELVIKIFQEMWFSEKISEDKTNKMALDIPSRVAQIMEVINSIEDDDWLVDLLVKVLEEKDKKRIAVCSRLCERLVETILTQPDTKAAVVSAVKGLHTFCKAYPPLLIPHAPTLATYLQVTDRSNKDESTIALHVAKILERTIPFIEHPDPAFLAQVESELVNLIQTQNTPVVQSCVQCLCEMVNKVTKRPNKLEDLVRKYYPILEAVKTQAPVKIVQTIFTIGLMCRYFDFDVKGIKLDPSDPKGSRVLQPAHVVDTFLDYFLLFSKHQDIEIGVRALHGIGCLCLRKPQLLASSKVISVFQSALVDPSPRRKEAILKVLADMLEGEDDKAKQPIPKGKSEGVSVDDSSFGLIGTTMQQHLEKILTLLLDKDERVRSAAITTTHRIVSHRLVIPIDCVPYLIALEGDDSSLGISDAAHKLLLLINDKHPSFLLNRIVEGVKRMFAFRRELYGNEKDTRRGTLAVVKVYGVIKNSRVNRNNFLSSLVKTLEDARNEEVDASLSRFICEIAAFLPYSSPDEPVTIVQTIDKIVSLQGNSVLNFLKITSPSSSSLSSNDLKCNCSSANNIIFLLELKRFLISRYSLSARYKNLAPNEAPKGPLTDKLVHNDETQFPDVHPFSQIIPFSVSCAKDLHTKLKTIMKEDEAEYFPLVTSSPSKPKRGRAAAANKKRKPAGDSKPKRKPKKLKIAEGDDAGQEDGDDDYQPKNS